MSECHAKILESLVPRRHLAVLQNRHSIFNSATYGVARNQYWSGHQINIASPTHGAVKTLQDQLGSVGNGHGDLNDCCASYTAMTAAINLQKGVHPGNFHFLALGAYVTLTHLTTPIFSAPHQHGGTAPCVPADMTPHSDDLRVGLISYPNLIALERSRPIASYSLVHGNDIAGVLATPGSLVAGDPKAQIPVNSRTTFARNGLACMDKAALERLLLRDEFILKHWKDAQSGLLSSQTLKFEDFANSSDGVPMEAWLMAPGGSEQLREKELYRLGLLRLRVSATMWLLLDRQVTNCFIEGVPRVFDREVAELEGLLSQRHYTKRVRDPALTARLLDISKKASTYSQLIERRAFDTYTGLGIRIPSARLHISSHVGVGEAFRRHQKQPRSGLADDAAARKDPKWHLTPVPRELLPKPASLICFS